MQAPEYRMASRETAIAFLDACTATPVTEEALFAAGKVSTLLEYAVRSGDTTPLKSALLDCDHTAQFFDFVACAIHTLTDSLSDQPLASLHAFVHRCAEIEEELSLASPGGDRVESLAVAM